MRLHTDTVTEADLEKAAKAAGVELAGVTRHGSRKRDHAFEVRLAGSGIHGGQFGSLDHKNATWDEWGMFLAQLYQVDAGMEAGPYKGDDPDQYESFDYLTGSRYRDLVPQQQHKRHRWEFLEVEHTYCFTPGLPTRLSVQACKCGAVRRFVTDRVQVGRLSA